MLHSFSKYPDPTFAGDHDKIQCIMEIRLQLWRFAPKSSVIPMGCGLGKEVFRRTTVDSC